MKADFQLYGRQKKPTAGCHFRFSHQPAHRSFLLFVFLHAERERWKSIQPQQQIYEEVWGEEYFYDDSNIMAIISRLRKKLEVNPSSPKYIQTVKGIGYRFNKEV